MEAKFKILAVWVAIALLVYFIGVSMPAQQQTVFYVSSFGFLALLTLCLVLLIPPIVRWQNNSFTRFLLVNRRWVGLSAFLFALTHIALVYHFFFAWDILKPLSLPNSLFLNLGAVAFLILALMAATSNDFSVSALGKNWKRLHLFVYLAFALVLIHGFNIGLVYFKEQAVQISIAVLVVLIALFKTGIVKIGN
ncbi:MAG: ferric reductase-like transmembrane domain-containing protein [Candidatus Norongarragalinales archaeon]